MKKAFFLLSMVFCLLGVGFGQGKVTSALSVATQSAQANEKFSIIVTLSEQYDLAGLESRTRFLSNRQRATLAMEELKQFAAYSQKDIVTTLAGNPGVSDLNTHWLYNGLDCKATKEVIETLAQRSDVANIDLDIEYVSKPLNLQEAEIDRSYNGQWGIGQIHADQVWETLGYTGKNILVAVVDSGVRYDHPGLVNNMWNGGVQYPTHGYNFINGSYETSDEFGQGTMVAGLIAGNAASYKTGIAPDAKIMALRVTNRNGVGAMYSTISQATEFAADHGAKIVVITACESGSTPSASYLQMMQSLMALNIVAVTPAGDEGQSLTPPSSISTPSNCPSPWHNPDEQLDGIRSANICVGATNPLDQKAPFSSIGPVTWANVSSTINDYPYTPGSETQVGLIRPDLVAPGTNITSLSHRPDAQYSTGVGTTAYSAAQVAGVIALLLEADPTLSPTDIDRILETTAVKCEGLTLKNNYYGAGRVDALEAVKSLFSTVEPPTQLNATADQNAITLTWTAAENAVSYEVFCNNELIASEVTGTSYIDQNTFAGVHEYSLKSNAADGTQSVMSDYVTVFVDPTGPVVNNLAATVNGNQVTLTWEAPQSETHLRYGQAETTGGNGIGNTDKPTYWAQRFKAAQLVNYSGFSIDMLSVYLNNPGNYRFSIYTGNPNGTDQLLSQKQVTVSAAQVPGWYDIQLDSPVSISIDKDLWLVGYAPATISKPIAWNNLSSPSSNAALMSTDGKNWFNYNDNVTWLMKAHLAGGNYTYNVQRDNEEVVSNLNTLSYVDPNVANGVHYYTVTTNYNNNQSVSNPCDPLRVNVNILFTVSFEAGSGTCTNSQITQPSSNATITLPSATPSSACASAGYTFAGWSTEIINGETEKPELMLAGSTYLPEDNITLYAVYENLQGGGWSLARSIANGDQVSIVGSIQNDNINQTVEFNGLDVANGVGAASLYTNTPEGLYPFTLLTSDGLNFLISDQNGNYLRKTNSSGKLALSTGSSGRAWSIEIIGDKAVLRNNSQNSNHQLVVSTLQGETVFTCVPYGENINNHSYSDIMLYRHTDSSFSSYDHNPTCGNSIPAPVFNPIADGIYLDPIAVRLSTTATGSNVEIRYTTNGTEPTINSQRYLNPINISSTKTVKAKVFRNGTGGPTAQQTYTFPTAYANIADYKAAANTNQPGIITGSLRVTQQYGKYLYVSDETGGLLLYDDYDLNSETYIDGDYVTSIQGCYKVVNGQVMMKQWHAAEKTGENSPVDPTVVTVQQVNNGYATYDAQLVRFQGVNFSESVESFSNTDYLYVVQGENNLLAVDRFAGVNCAIDAESMYDVIGILGKNNNEIRIYPRTNSDIQRYYNIATQSIGEGSIGIDVTSAAETTLITVNATPNAGYHVERLYYYGSNPAVQTNIDPTTMQFVMPSNDITVVAVFAVDVLYTVTFYKGNGNCATTTLSETAWHSGIVLPEATPSAACAAQGYTFAGWSENYINETLVTPTYYEPGSVYYPTNDGPLYAVYVIGGSEWIDVSDLDHLVDGSYVVTTKYNNRYYYLPHEGATTAAPNARTTTINAQGIPAASEHVWTIKQIDGSKDNPQYSITYTEDEVTYYLKAKANNPTSIHVSTYNPECGWEFTYNSSKGLLAHFPNPVADPKNTEATMRYMGLYYNGLYASKWYYQELGLYTGQLHLFMVPSNTYATNPTCQAMVDAPTFLNLPEGNIDSDSYQVTLTHSSPEVNIYYTIDDSEPSQTSTLYSGPFYIYDDCTVKAIAIDGEGNHSSIASHDFTFITRFNTIAEFKEACTSTNNVEVKITGNVTVVYHDAPYLYVNDTTASLMIHDANNVITSTYTNGKVINGGLFGTMKVINGQKQLIPTRDPALGILDTPIDPVAANANDLNNSAFDAMLVKLINIEIFETHTIGDSHYVYAKQGDNGFYIHDLFGDLSIDIESGHHYDITGFVGTNNQVSSTLKCLYPRTDSDFVPYYAIVCDNTVENGTVEVSLTQAKPGTEVTVTATPNSEYDLGAIIVTDCNDQEVEVVNNVFVMPACDVNVTATFDKHSYSVTWTANPAESGTVTIEEEGPYYYGDIIHVTAVPATGYQFHTWYEGGLNTNISEASTTFVITGNLVLIAVFREKEDTENVDQVITLGSGWTWFSLYLELGDEAIDLIKAGIAASSATGYIKAQTDGFITYEEGTWEGTPFNIVNEEMYLIQSEGCEFTLTAPAADPAAHPITLNEGWSWIGFISSNAMELSEALSGITPTQNDQIKAQNSFSTYDETNGWAGALTELTPGIGYLYLHNGSSIELIYPSASKGIVEATPMETYWKGNHTSFPTNLTMMVTLDESQINMAKGSHEIGAFVQGECRGSARLQEINGRYIAFLTVSGESYDEVSFRLYDVTEGMEYASVANERIIYTPNAVYGNIKEPMALHFSTTGVGGFEANVSLFPNPASKQITILCPDMEQVSIVSLTGQVLRQETLNANELLMDLEGLAQGLYLVNITTSNGISIVRKLNIK